MAFGVLLCLASGNRVKNVLYSRKQFQESFTSCINRTENNYFCKYKYNFIWKRMSANLIFLLLRCYLHDGKHISRGLVMLFLFSHCKNRDENKVKVQVIISNYVCASFI